MTQLFKDFWLKPQLLKAIEKLGYTEPTQIQADVWNAAKDGANIVGQSQTGTGKTTAFLLPLLQQIDNKDRYPQVLIVAPTRELVQQIRDDIMKLTEFLPMRSMTLMGGKSLRFQKEDLRYWPQFIVATPGRLIEFMQERYLDVSKITHFVLDEVDRMLDMGFIEDVDRIWSQLDNLKQTMTFSATINSEIKDIIARHCPEHVHIRVGATITVDKIDHTYIDMAHEHKFPTLMHLLRSHEGQKTIIFSQTKRNTEVIARALFKEKFKVQFLNGDLDMKQRTRALRAFKEWTCKILVTTDVAARGLNMDAVELVVNFDVPREPESYIHRIGRTWRAGAEGKAIMFVDNDERHLVMEIEKTQKIKLKKSDKIQAVTDNADDYLDINLDRPLPPSDKKRRMVARSLARERWEFGGRSSGWRGWFGWRWGDRGWFGWRSSGGRSGGFSRDRWFGSDRGGDRAPSRWWFERRSFSSDRPARSFSDRPRREEWQSSFGRLTASGFDSAPRQDRQERAPRSFNTDRPARSFDRPMSDWPRRDFSRAPRSNSQFDSKPESRRDRNTTYGERAFGEKKSFSDRPRSPRPARSIGGYDVDFITEQRTMDRDRFAPRWPRKDWDRPSRSSDRSPRTGGRPSWDRSSKPRLSSRPKQ